MKVRQAIETDAEGIRDIWNAVIRHSLITFNASEKSTAEVADLIGERTGQTGGFLVAVDDDSLLGFATYAPVPWWRRLRTHDGAHDLLGPVSQRPRRRSGIDAGGRRRRRSKRRAHHVCRSKQCQFGRPRLPRGDGIRRSGRIARSGLEVGPLAGPAFDAKTPVLAAAQQIGCRHVYLEPHRRGPVCACCR